MARAPARDLDVTVIIAKSLREAKRHVERPLFVILPDFDNFNDYGYRLYAKLVLITKEEKTEVFPIRLMFEDKKQSEPILSGLLEKTGPVFPVTEIEIPFCSLQNEASDYERLIDLVGFDAAVGALRALHDAVLANLEGEDTETIRLTRTDAFHLGMIRSAPRYTAFRRGGRFLRPNTLLRIDDAATSFSMEVSLPSYTKDLKIAFDFDPDPIFQDRCCVLIGRNGVGKTQLLRAVIEQLMDDTFSEDSYRPISRVMVFSSVPSDPYPKAIAPWDGLDYEYFAVVTDEKPLGEGFMRALVDCLRGDGSNFGTGERRRARLKLLQDLLQPLGLWDNLYVPVRSDPENTFRLVLDVDGKLFVQFGQGFNERDQNFLASQIDLARPAIILSDEQQIRHLSSGEIAMAQFVAQSVAAIENGCLLLFDEPETHLHPNYISQFMDILQELLDLTGSIAIIATHSAYVLREVPRQRVNVLVRDNAVAVALTPRMQTFGANIDELSQFVFGEGAVSPRFRRRLIEWGKATVAEIGIDGIVDRYASQLSPSTLAIVAHAVRDVSGS